MSVRSTRKKIVALLALTMISVAALQALMARAVWSMPHAVPTASGCACNVAQGFSLDLIRPEGLSYMIWGLVVLFAASWLIGLVYFFATVIKTHRFIKRQPCGVFTFGLIRPQISVCAHCEETLPATELQAMLAHEKHHVRRRDPLKFLVLDTLRWAVFYVPLISTLVKLYRTAIEIEADEQVEDREALGEALVRVVDSHVPVAVANFATVISERIERLVNPQWSLRFQLSGAQIMLSVFFLAGIFGILNMPQKTAARAGVCVHAAPTQCIMQTPTFDRAPAVYYTTSL